MRWHSTVLNFANAILSPTTTTTPTTTPTYKIVDNTTFSVIKLIKVN
jgi:hypothetical protein